MKTVTVSIVSGAGRFHLPILAIAYMVRRTQATDSDLSVPMYSTA